MKRFLTLTPLAILLLLCSCTGPRLSWGDTYHDRQRLVKVGDPFELHIRSKKPCKSELRVYRQPEQMLVYKGINWGKMNDIRVNLPTREAGRYLVYLESEHRSQAFTYRVLPSDSPISTTRTPRAGTSVAEE